MSIDELWRPVLHYEGYYEVSNFGRVRSLDRIYEYQSKNQTTEFRCQKTKRGKILAQVNRGRGYLCVSLYKAGKTKLVNTHILVAEAFLGERLTNLFVNHKDGNKANNNLSNLEWVTTSQNHKHAVDTLGLLRGEKHGMAKLSESDVFLIKQLIMEGVSAASIAKDFPVSESQIKKIRNGTSWSYLNAKC
jgi:hypothetical protein